MSAGAEYVLVFDADGAFGAVYADELQPYLAVLGPARTVRAGHVEPGPRGGWVATLEPWVQPDSAMVASRPFPTRGEALGWEAAEVNAAIAAGRRPAPLDNDEALW